MLIHRLLENTAFGPTDVEAMAQAFETICAELKITRADERELVARKVVNRGQCGTLNSQDIRKMVVSEFQDQAAPQLGICVAAGGSAPSVKLPSEN